MEGFLMDEIDLKIVSTLQKDARISLKKLADICFISAPAVSTRLTHLEERGIIKNYQTSIDYKILGYPIKAYVSLRLSPKDKDDFYPYIKSVGNVISCDCVTGSYSQIITCYFKSTRALDNFINDIQRFGETKTQIVFSTSVIQRPLELNPGEVYF
ncbi:AsnC family transcriptional regulator [Liquorilactobacillus mali KCTC 3596 = DSM 20444]|uniref:AsnC family transcriptional regulator n=2 Tax=Liquorilactobacillus mali TaxID=1618 RepID=A0A0R2EB66_9LACO|nr:AsnC family transcriptional regulator [Liquorilactobacillus mali KCTC 3596 = DSM 20444]